MVKEDDGGRYLEIKKGTELKDIPKEQLLDIVNTVNKITDEDKKYVDMEGIDALPKAEAQTEIKFKVKKNADSTFSEVKVSVRVVEELKQQIIMKTGEQPTAPAGYKTVTLDLGDGVKDGYKLKEWSPGIENLTVKEDKTIKAVYYIFYVDPVEYTAGIELKKEKLQDDIKAAVHVNEGETVTGVTVTDEQFKIIKVNDKGEYEIKATVTVGGTPKNDVEVIVRIGDPAVIEVGKGQKPASYKTVKFEVGNEGTLQGASEFYVAPTKEVTIPVKTPVGKNGYEFEDWDKVIKNVKFTEDTVVKAKFKDTATEVAKSVDTKEGKKPNVDDYKKVIETPSGKELKSTKIVENIKADKQGTEYARIEVTYKDGDTKYFKVRVNVGPKDVYAANSDGSRPDGVPDSYIKVTFDPGENGTANGDTVFYVKPGTKVSVPVKSPNAKSGYEFDHWELNKKKADPSNLEFKEGAEEQTIKAVYSLKKKEGQCEDKNNNDKNDKNDKSDKVNGTDKDGKDGKPGSTSTTNKDGRSIPKTLAEVSQKHGFKILVIISALALVFLGIKKKLMK